VANLTSEAGVSNRVSSLGHFWRAEVGQFSRAPRFSSVKSETADRFDSCGVAKMELFDYIEVFYNQRRRHSTLGQVSPAEFERRKNEEGMDPMENRQERGFPQAPHPSSFSMKEENATKNDRVNQPVH